MYFEKIDPQRNYRNEDIWSRICELDACANAIQEEYGKNVYAALLDAKYLQYVIDRDKDILTSYLAENFSEGLSNELSEYLIEYLGEIQLGNDTLIYPDKIMETMSEINEGKSGYKMFKVLSK